MIRRLPCLALAALSFGGVDVPGKQQVFRATTDAVLVDVSVTLERRPVADLRSDDFVLTDNSVAQQIDDFSPVTMPIDLTLIVDTGNEARFLGLSSAIQRDAQLVRRLIRPSDRGSLVTVDSQMRWGGASEDASLRGERGTVLLDAICAAEMMPVDPGRRHLIVVVTAGIETHSLTIGVTQERILARSESPVYVVGGGPIFLAGTYVADRPGGTLVDPRHPVPDMAGVLIAGAASLLADYSGSLRAVAEATGGQFLDLGASKSDLSPLDDAVERLRTSYVLRYRPLDVGSVGWHTLSVKINRPGGFDVRARRGYWRN